MDGEKKNQKDSEKIPETVTGGHEYIYACEQSEVKS